MNSKKAFDGSVHAGLSRLLDKLASIAQHSPAARDTSKLEELAQELSALLSTMVTQLMGTGSGSTPELHHLSTRVDNVGGTAFSAALPKLRLELAKLVKDPKAAESAMLSGGFLKGLEGLVALVRGVRAPQPGETPEAGNARKEKEKSLVPHIVKDLEFLSNTCAHAAANPINKLSPSDTSTHFASDGEFGEPQPVAQDAIVPATNADSMMGSIEALVRDLENFIENVPVTAFHDRDAEKVARARTKASELRDDILMIRKQVGDTKSALNGETPQAERFASMARSVITKYVGHV